MINRLPQSATAGAATGFVLGGAIALFMGRKVLPIAGLTTIGAIAGWALGKTDETSRPPGGNTPQSALKAKREALHAFKSTWNEEAKRREIPADQHPRVIEAIKALLAEGPLDPTDLSWAYYARWKPELMAGAPEVKQAFVRAAFAQPTHFDAPVWIKSAWVDAKAQIDDGNDSAWEGLTALCDTPVKKAALLASFFGELNEKGEWKEEGVGTFCALLAEKLDASDIESKHIFPFWKKENHTDAFHEILELLPHESIGLLINETFRWRNEARRQLHQIRLESINAELLIGKGLEKFYELGGTFDLKDLKFLERAGKLVPDANRVLDDAEQALLTLSLKLAQTESSARNWVWRMCFGMHHYPFLDRQLNTDVERAASYFAYRFKEPTHLAAIFGSFAEVPRVAQQEIPFLTQVVAKLKGADGKENWEAKLTAKHLAPYFAIKTLREPLVKLIGGLELTNKEAILAAAN